MDDRLSAAAGTVMRFGKWLLIVSSVFTLRVFGADAHAWKSTAHSSYHVEDPTRTLLLDIEEARHTGQSELFFTLREAPAGKVLARAKIAFFGVETPASVEKKLQQVTEELSRGAHLASIQSHGRSPCSFDLFIPPQKEFDSPAAAKIEKRRGVIMTMVFMGTALIYGGAVAISAHPTANDIYFVLAMTVLGVHSGCSSVLGRKL